MDHLIPSLAQLLVPFAECFRQEVFQTFSHLVAGWALCPGPHTISEVWQATGLAAKRHHDTAYSFFRSAKWDFDDIGKILLLLIVAQLIPTGHVFLVVDDTLCHKRGKHVAFAGFFLDAVTSTRKRKNFRFGLNWVVLGLSVHLPFRKDRYFCLPVLWRVFHKKGSHGHKKRTEVAAELAHLAALALPARDCWLIGDQAYVAAATLKNRPANLKVLRPVRLDAALYEPAPVHSKRPRKKGERLPQPKEMLADEATWIGYEREVRLLERTRRLRLQEVHDVLWYSGAGSERLTLVLVRDLEGQWRDTALLASDPAVSGEWVVACYCRRWGIEAAFFDSKQFLGLHEPHVWAEGSVERAHPFCWLVQSLTVLWYATAGKDGPQVQRDRKWYNKLVGPTFADMLGALRLQLWQHRLACSQTLGSDPKETLEILLHWVAAVR